MKKGATKEGSFQPSASCQGVAQNLGGSLIDMPKNSSPKDGSEVISGGVCVFSGQVAPKQANAGLVARSRQTAPWTWTVCPFNFSQGAEVCAGRYRMKAIAIDLRNSLSGKSPAAASPRFDAWPKAVGDTEPWHLVTWAVSSTLNPKHEALCCNRESKKNP